MEKNCKFNLHWIIFLRVNVEMAFILRLLMALWLKESLIETFSDFFPEEIAQPPNWIRNPFSFVLNSMDDNADELKEQLIGYKSKTLPRKESNVRSFNDIWCSQKLVIQI